MSAAAFREHTFQNAAAAAANGTEVDLLQASLVSVQIKGATFSGTVVFEVRHTRAGSTDWIPVAGVKISDMTTWASTITDPTAEGYFVTVRGFDQFRCRVTRTVGSVSVWGTVVGAGF